MRRLICKSILVLVCKSTPLAGQQALAGGLWKTNNRHTLLLGHPRGRHARAIALEVASRIMCDVQEIARAAALVPALQNASLGSFSVAKSPYPQDALPIIGWLPDKEGKVYVAVTHSGATLGPLLGR